MQVVGRVIETKNNLAYVTLLRTSACGGNCKACGSSCETIDHKIEVINSIDAKVGEIVEVSMDEKNGLKASAIIYIIPLLGFLISIVVGYMLKLSEIQSFLLGVIGMVISYLIVHLIDKKNRNVNSIIILPYDKN